METAIIASREELVFLNIMYDAGKCEAWLGEVNFLLGRLYRDACRQLDLSGEQGIWCRGRWNL
jgi:hypothetical protein